MKHISVKIAFLSLLFISSITLAQNIDFDKKNFADSTKALKQAKSSIRKGNSLYEQGGAMYREALTKYLIAQKLNPNNAQLNYKIGKCYIKGSEKAKSLEYFQKAYQLNTTISNDILFLLGWANQLNYKWDDAVAMFVKYKALPKIKNMEEVDKHISECKVGKELLEKPIRVFIDNLGPVVNTAYNEGVPVISADESVLMFTSRRPNTTGERKDDRDLDYYEDIYITKNEKDQWQAPINPGKPLNTKGHDAVVGLSNDGQLLLTYKGDKDGGDIYVSRLKGDRWSKPKALKGHINTKYHEPSASISPDGKTIYYTSSKKKGLGGLDIYKCIKNKHGKWKHSENLGKVINTQFDEDAVFIHPDGKTLYFSSKGHNTMGGFDIFKSVRDSLGKWSTPENIGAPINTPDNDGFFVLAANGRHGYYSSARDGGLGGQDLYLITFLGPEKQPINNSEDNLIASIAEPISADVVEPTIAVASGQLTMLKGFITDTKTALPLTASIELVDNKLKQVIATFESNSKTGKYLVSLPAGRNYGITVKVPGYLFHSENFDIMQSAGYSEVIKNITLDKIEVGSKIVLKNIFFEFGKATLTSESTMELDNLAKLLNEYSSLKIEISGHTDNKGTDAINLSISEARAKAVVDYLVNTKKISSSRLTSKGYGKTQPIAPNETEDGRQQNRRTEFKIISK